MSAPLPNLDLIFGALADPTRRAILARLAAGESSVTTLVEGCALSQPAVSKHLKVLERAGLVSRAKVARFRPVRLNPAPLEQAALWIGGYQQFWEATLDNLDQYVRALHAQAPQEKNDDPTRNRKKPR
jgi:DNA-binding transcriptional ArsR family regulator